MTTALRSFILFLGQAIIACIPVLAVIANCVVVQRVAWRPAAAEKTLVKIDQRLHFFASASLPCVSAGLSPALGAAHFSTTSIVLWY